MKQGVLTEIQQRLDGYFSVECAKIIKGQKCVMFGHLRVDKQAQ